VPPQGTSYFKDLFRLETLRLIFRLASIFSFVVLFWALFDQVGTLWQVQSRYLVRILPEWVPFWGGYELLPAQIGAVFNPLFILLLVPIFSRYLYPVLERITPLTDLKKIGIGLWLMVLAFMMVSLIQERVELGETLHIGWQILACAILTASEVMVSITCLEFAYKQAPKAMKSLVMALFLLTVSLGNYLASAVKFFLSDQAGNSVLTGAAEFWFWTSLMAGGAFVYVFVSRKYRSVEYLSGSA